MLTLILNCILSCILWCLLQRNRHLVFSLLSKLNKASMIKAMHISMYICTIKISDHSTQVNHTYIPHKMGMSSEIIMPHENKCVKDATSLKIKPAVHAKYFWDIIKQQIGTLFTTQIWGKNISQHSYLSFARIKSVPHSCGKIGSPVVMLIEPLKSS